MKKIYTNVIIISLVLFFTGCATSYNQEQLNIVNKTKELCKNQVKSNSAWHISNLYDCKTQSFFIPYELWSGAEYKGDKVSSKKHQVDRQSETSHYGKSGRLSYSDLSILGTTKWISDEYNKEFDIYTRDSDGKIQYFITNDMGIGRVYDDRGSGRYFSGSNIKFPAGYGWRLNEARSSGYEVVKNGRTKYRNTTIKIINIKLTDTNELDSITFEWYPKDGELDRIYTYRVNIGLVETRRP